MKKKVFICTLIIVVCLPVIVRVKSNRVERELEDAKVFLTFSGNYLYDLEWERDNYLFFEEFKIQGQYWMYYNVNPIKNRYMRGFVQLFGPKELPKRFPEDIWPDEMYSRRLYHPYANVEERKDLEGISTTTVSFSRPCTVDEVSKMNQLTNIKWLWVDTYQTDSTYYDYYNVSLFEENSAYGINCSRKDLKESAEAFVQKLNQYQENTNTTFGKKILKMKKGISNNEEITIDDIKILGCICSLDESEINEIEENSMFRCIQDGYCYD